MKITNIQISNFLGARAVNLSLTKPVALIAGGNGAGKSSIQEAVRMALTGEPKRVNLKKDFGQLVTDEQKNGFASVTAGGKDYSITLPGGKGAHCNVAALPYVLDAQRFASLNDNARRQFLLGLMGVKMDGESVKKRLLDKGFDAAKVDEIMPSLLLAGFDAASTEAANKARDKKAIWKATTGETWGEVKAASWTPAPLPDGSDRAAAKAAAIEKQIAEAQDALNAANQELGAARAELTRREVSEKTRLELKGKADQARRIQDRINLAKADIAAWEQKVADCRALAGVGQPNPKAPGEFLLRGLATVTGEFLALSSSFPEVEWPAELINRAAAHHAEYVKLHGDPVGNDSGPDPEAVANLPKYENALALSRNTLKNGERDLSDALAAQAKYDLCVQEQAMPMPDVAKAEAGVQEKTTALNEWRADLKKYSDLAALAASREAVTVNASSLHGEIMAWLAISDALAPAGIPAELLTEALGPINERLSKSAVLAEWLPVAIGADMSIRYGGRDYALISESEKWRADAMIAEAVSCLSGVKLLVLDRFDVLELKGREDLLYWIDALAEGGEIDTALIFGTLKALPAVNLPTIEAFWVSAGSAGNCGQIKEAA